MSEILTTDEVAKMFRVGQRTVYRWIAAQKLDAFQTPGGHWRIRGESVRRLWESMMVQEPAA